MYNKEECLGLLQNMSGVQAMMGNPVGAGIRDGLLASNGMSLQGASAENRTSAAPARNFMADLGCK